MSEKSRPGWRAEPAALHFATALIVSFQRYIVADAPPLPAIPLSLGALGPHESVPGIFLIPLHDGEAVWLALEFGKQAPPVRIVATGASGRRNWSIAAHEPGTIEMLASVPGHGEHERRFGAAKDDWRAIELVADGGEPSGAIVELVDAPTFESRTGRRAPEPARREEAYGGWRLP